MKQCPKCQSEFEDEYEFCPNDGTSLQELGEQSLVSGKIFARGDVNISNTTHHNVTNINQQDDSKKLMTCVVSGRQSLATEGAVCGKCDKWAHKEFFDFAQSECSNCKDIRLENNEKEYKENFLNFIRDDRTIDPQERSNLQNLGEKLGLDSAKISQIETEIRRDIESKILNARSYEEEVRINKAKESLFQDLNFKEAFSELSELKESLPQDEEVFDLYVWAATAEEPKYALESLEKSVLANVDSPEKSFYLVNIHEALGEDSEASEELKRGLSLFPDSQRLRFKQLERLIDLYFDYEQDPEQLKSLKEYHHTYLKKSEVGEDAYLKFVNSFFKIAFDTDFLNISELKRISKNYHFNIKANAVGILKKYKIVANQRLKEKEKRLLVEEQRKKAEEKRKKERAIAEAKELEKEIEQKAIAAKSRAELTLALLAFVITVLSPALSAYLLWGDHEVKAAAAGLFVFIRFLVTDKSYLFIVWLVFSLGLLIYAIKSEFSSTSSLDENSASQAGYEQALADAKSRSKKLSPSKKETINYKNGDRYEGEVSSESYGSKKLKHGEGKLFYANGGLFEGEFKDDQRYRGYHLYAGGDSFDGEFKNDLKLDGIYRWASGNSFEGLWRNGQPHNGSFRFSDGDRYEGYFNFTENELRFHGQGKYFFSNGSRFEGYYREDEAYQGRLHYTDGNLYEGSFKGKRPVPEGQGKLYFADGKVYEGTVFNGFAGGEGSIHFQGEDYACKWKEFNIELVKKRGLLGELLSIPFKIFEPN